MSQPSTGRRRALGLLLALVAPLAAGCGGAGPLDEKQTIASLITVDNLGAGWVQEPADVDPTGGSGGAVSGCLSAAEQITSLEAVHQANATFTYTRGTLSVANSVSTYEDSDTLTKEFTAASEDLADCTSVTSRSQGSSFTASITTDQAASSEKVDRQLNVAADGTLTIQGQSRPFHVLISVVQIGTTLTSVQTIDTAEVGELHGTYVDIAIARLSTVSEGDQPEKTTAPPPAAPAG